MREGLFIEQSEGRAWEGTRVCPQAGDLHEHPHRGWLAASEPPTNVLKRGLRTRRDT